MLPDQRIEEIAGRVTSVGGAGAETRAAAIIKEAMTESDYCLYWAMVNDGVLQRNEEIEKQYAARLK